MSTFHDLNFNDTDGNNVSFNQFKDKVVYVTNVASAWGKTRRHYTQLQVLHEDYKDDGLEIIAFPCNQFGRQEPGTDKEIKKFTNHWAIKKIFISTMKKIPTTPKLKIFFQKNI